MLHTTRSRSHWLWLRLKFDVPDQLSRCIHRAFLKVSDGSQERERKNLPSRRHVLTQPPSCNSLHNAMLYTVEMLQPLKGKCFSILHAPFHLRISSLCKSEKSPSQIILANTSVRFSTNISPL